MKDAVKDRKGIFHQLKMRWINGLVDIDERWKIEKKFLYMYDILAVTILKIKKYRNKHIYRSNNLAFYLFRHKYTFL